MEATIIQGLGFKERRNAKRKLLQGVTVEEFEGYWKAYRSLHFGALWWPSVFLGTPFLENPR